MKISESFKYSSLHSSLMDIDCLQQANNPTGFQFILQFCLLKCVIEEKTKKTHIAADAVWTHWLSEELETCYLTYDHRSLLLAKLKRPGHEYRVDVWQSKITLLNNWWGWKRTCVCVCEKEKYVQLDSSFQSNEYCHSVMYPLYGPPFSGFDLLQLKSTIIFSLCMKKPTLCHIS